MNHIQGGAVIKPAINANIEKMSADKLAMFQQVFEGIQGAGYTPLLYIGSQLVAGELCSFIALRTFVQPQAEHHAIVKIVIFKSLNNALSLHSISEI